MPVSDGKAENEQGKRNGHCINLVMDSFARTCEEVPVHGGIDHMGASC